MRYVQYGCGLCAPEEWINYDASPTLKVQKIPVLGALLKKAIGQDIPFPSNVRFGDITKGLPEAEGTCDAVYCSHILEHLSLTDFRIALKHTYNMLKKGGTFRLVVPDMEYEARNYLKQLDSGVETASLDLMHTTCFGVENRPKGLKALLKKHYGNSSHLWMWDIKSLSHELKMAGFEKVRRSDIGDNPDPMFGLVEQEGRYTNCLGIEAIK